MGRRSIAGSGWWGVGRCSGYGGRSGIDGRGRGRIVAPVGSRRWCVIHEDRRSSSSSNGTRDGSRCSSGGAATTAGMVAATHSSHHAEQAGGHRVAGEGERRADLEETRQQLEAVAGVARSPKETADTEGEAKLASYHW